MSDFDRRPRSLGWIGGKSAFSSTGTGQWIVRTLPPPEERAAYIEPFSGMAGVLVQRDPATREILNDINEDLINWWRVVRDQPRELGELLDWTPGWSVAAFEEAVENLHHPDPVRRAYFFTLAVHWVRGNMVGRAYESREGADSRRTAEAQIVRQRGGSLGHPRSPQITTLSERIKNVELETREAEWIVGCYAENPDVVWYLDPPYSVADDWIFYTHNTVKQEVWLEMLKSITGLAAVSGYGDEWAALEDEGWLRHEHKTRAYGTVHSDRDDAGRTEVLWTNYRPADFSLNPKLF